jgi:hypothetical protein
MSSSDGDGTSPLDALNVAVAPESVSLPTYLFILAVLFFALPVSILIVRYNGWSKYMSLERFARRVPLQRLQALVLRNGTLSKRPLSQQLEAFLYSQTSWGYALDMVQAVLSLVSVALFIASSYRPPTEGEPVWALLTELLLTIYFLLDYFVRFYMAKDRLAYYFT